MKNFKIKLLFIIPFGLIVIAIFYFLFNQNNNENLIMSGIVESDEIDVSSKIPGRIESILVSKGDRVKKNQVIAILESKEMDAKVEQARGMMEAAKAKMILAHNGARKEEITAAEKMYEQAKAQFDYAEKTYKRFNTLFDDKVISLQEKDEIEFKYKAALNQLEAAKAKYEMIKKGARTEEIDAAESLLHQAENTYNEALAYHQELYVKSPIDGEVINLYSDSGEIINSGYPILSVLPENKNYVVLQVREDNLNLFNIGEILVGKVPAFGNKSFQFRIQFIAALGEFANWRPTNQKGEFDLRTFEVRLVPVNSNLKLRSGMTVNFEIKK